MSTEEMVAIFQSYGGAQWAYLAWLGAVTVAVALGVVALLLAVVAAGRR